MLKDQKIFESGKFFTGCNYWASHAGTNMWHDWNAEIVESDLKRLSEANIKVMRMFPLWSDFQPLRMHRSGGSAERELRIGEDPLPHTEEGRAGVDPVMIERFRVFLDLAEKYEIKLIVGLVTGWMSGRMYMPEAFAGKGLLTDPLVISWQTRFVRYMVKRFKDHPAIAAWDLGNECNCMQGVGRDAANVWASHISAAIKLEDREHPVVSGMHSMFPTGSWTPEDQSECLDILCTHPYPIFTPHCDTDPINEMKTVLHSTAETVMYESLGGIPAFIEEAGTLGPMIAKESVAGDYVRAAMFSAWAHDLRGFVWWCANEQSELEHTPYDWNSVERELGLFHIDGSKKPVLEEMTRFTNFVDNFEFGKLPPRITDAVCVLSEGQDVWAAGGTRHHVRVVQGRDSGSSGVHSSGDVRRRFAEASRDARSHRAREEGREALHVYKQRAALAVRRDDRTESRDEKPESQGRRCEAGRQRVQVLDRLQAEVREHRC